MLYIQELSSPELIQGTKEWLDFRKLHVTGTDAAVIMGVNPWKTIEQLYTEKTTDVKPLYMNERMQRGLDLEPVARELFNLKTGYNMQPEVIIKDWAMASLDGKDTATGAILEIKCPGQKDHALALDGKIPEYYYPQLQHQMYVSGNCMAFYFSFDGVDGVIVKVKRDDEYIEKMLIEEKKFYDCIMNKTPPEGSYINRDDGIWEQCATRWLAVNSEIRLLEKEEEDLRKQLIFLSGESNTKGGGITLCQVSRKGNIDYSKIQELKEVDLEKYRKAPTTSWRITCN